MKKNKNLKYICALLIIFALMNVICFAATASYLTQTDTYSFTESSGLSRTDYKIRVFEDRKHGNTVYVFYNDAANPSSAISVVKGK